MVNNSTNTMILASLHAARCTRSWLPVLLLLLGGQKINRLVSGHGYLSSPRSRNLLAYEETVWWPLTENDPAPETCPQCLNKGGTAGACGIAGDRNYDTPKNALGGPMPTMPQATYTQGQDIIVNVTLTAHHKGHFIFSACPVLSSGDIPSLDCFAQHRLIFVEDMIYGANADPNYPERAYIAPMTDPNYVPDYSASNALIEYSFKMKLPQDVYGDLVLIQWYVKEFPISLNLLTHSKRFIIDTKIMLVNSYHYLLVFLSLLEHTQVLSNRQQLLPRWLFGIQLARSMGWQYGHVNVTLW